MGTPAFAVPILEALIERHQMLAVYTRPDAISGRGTSLRPAPIKELALRHEIPVLTPRSFYAYSPDGFLLRDAGGQRIVDADLVSQLQEMAPDFVIVAAYGHILPQAILDVPRYGCINVHASLLPHWRGAAPIQRALLAGDESQGVSIMRMEEGLDNGDFCAFASTATDEKDLSQLTVELGQLGARALIEALPQIASGSAVWIRQDETQATYAAKIAKDELWLTPQLSALDNLRRVRASSQQAPARCTIAGKQVTVLAARLDPSVAPELIDATYTAHNAAVVYTHKRLFLDTADGLLEILELKPDGKRKMSAVAFASGIKALQGSDLLPTITWSSC